MRLSSRFVWVFQWIAPIVLPLWLLLGRGLLGAPLGWFIVMMIIFIPVFVVVMYLPPIVGLFDGESRRAARSRLGFSVASWVQWVAFLIAGLAVYDGGDSGSAASVLSGWFGISEDTSTVMMLVMIAIAGLAMLVQLGLAIAGIVASRRHR